jgi:broad-specificity NMP kinase
MGDTPLFIVTGLSAAGKTKTSKELRRIASSNFYVFDMDILVESNDFQKACCQWLEIARYNSMSDKATVLFGSVPSPYNLSQCKNYESFREVYTVLLHCEHEDRYNRLKDRGDIWLDENIWLTIEEAEKDY